jgi:hypothetical protein
VKYLATVCSGLRALVIAALAGSAGGGAQAQTDTDREAAEWNAARGIGTADAYQRYLERFPIGRYSGDAFRCIIELTVDPDAVSSCSSAPGAGPAGGASVSTRGLAIDLY